MQLFPHQIKGVDFLTSSEGTKGLFFGMGTGKTLTAIYAFNKSDATRMLVIAPPIALPMWSNECIEHGDIDVDGTVQILKAGKTQIDLAADILIVSYAIAAKRAEALRDWLAEATSVLVCDESHALKSVKAKRTTAILGRGGIVSGATYSWMLTGTPITRWNDDVYPFVARADMKCLREHCGGNTMEKFQLRYTVRQPKQFPGARFPVKMVVGNRNTDELANWVYGDGLALRVDLEEVFASMPPLTTNRYDIQIEMGAELRDLLKQMEKLSISEIEALARKQDSSLSSARRLLGIAKCKAAIAEIMERVNSGQNVLVGAWHTDVIDMLQHAIHDAPLGDDLRARCATIDGRTSAARKQEIQNQWNAGELNVVVAQIAAAGVSLNLQRGGSQIVVVEEDWSPSIMDQFYARLWRYGQEKHVHVDILTTATKLDRALGRISGTKAREHGKFNAIGREVA